MAQVAAGAALERAGQVVEKAVKDPIFTLFIILIVAVIFNVAVSFTSKEDWGYAGGLYDAVGWVRDVVFIQNGVWLVLAVLILGAIAQFLRLSKR